MQPGSIIPVPGNNNLANQLNQAGGGLSSALQQMQNAQFNQLMQAQRGMLGGIATMTAGIPLPAMPLNRKAQAIVRRLRKIDYEHPPWDEKKIIKHLKRHFELIGPVPMPKVEVVESLANGLPMGATPFHFPTFNHIRESNSMDWNLGRTVAREALHSATWDRIFDTATSLSTSGPRIPSLVQNIVSELVGALNSGVESAQINQYIEVQMEMLKALEAGLGFYLPLVDRVIISPLPRMIVSDGRLHFDHGKAVEWKDGSGWYFLHGVQFDEKLYRQVVDQKITLNNLGRIQNADQRAAVVQMLRPDRLLKQVRAKLIHTGMKGTKLYRVDNFMDTGSTEYCMLMTHPSIPKLQYIEWVDPKVGRLENADVAQCHAWADEDGNPIPLEDYLLAVEA